MSIRIVRFLRGVAEKQQVWLGVPQREISLDNWAP
jgi:hypothetical protein